MAETESGYKCEVETNLSVDDQLDKVVSLFKQAYGHAPTHASVAPGRVNLIGEHTDYNDGYVLPMAIEKQTVMVAAPREDQQARLRSTAFETEAQFQLSPALAPGEPGWANYVRGVVAGYIEKGINPGGFDCLMDSTVPVGGGLSSSASVEVATATLIESLSGKRIDPVDITLLCQKAEHDFANVPCGLMDQFIATFALPDTAMLMVGLYDPYVVPNTDPGFVQ